MKTVSGLSALAFALSAGLAFADQSPQPVQQHNSNAIWFENWTGLSNATMKIAFPTGEFATIETNKGTPVFKLEGSEVADGIYRYELSAATEKTQKIVNPIDNGRGENARDSVAVPFNLSGQFVVSRGVIVTPKEVKEE